MTKPGRQEVCKSGLSLQPEDKKCTKVANDVLPNSANDVLAKLASIDKLGGETNLNGLRLDEHRAIPLAAVRFARVHLVGRPLSRPPPRLFFERTLGRAH
eukprot:5996096-Pyramimonas_sp.AAC.1